MGYHYFQKKKKKYAAGTALNYCSQSVPNFAINFVSDIFSNDEAYYCKLKKPGLELGANIFQQNTNYCASVALFNMGYVVDNLFIGSCNYCEKQILFEMNFVSSNKFTENVNYCYRPLL